MTPLDLSAPERALSALVKVRAALDGSDTFTWFQGDIWGWQPGTRQTKLLGFEGYNVARAVPADGGYDLLTREAVFYLDPESRVPIDRWVNTMTGTDVPVTQIWNDPVNLQLRVNGPYGPLRIPVTECGDDVVLTVDVFLTYPSPLSRQDYPEHSQSDLYQGAELFHFVTRRAALEDETTDSAPSTVSWTRIGPWLPWMRMGDAPGQLVYRGQGGKLIGGYAALPQWLRQRVEAENPVFASAPREFTGPNETSWTYFKRQYAANA
jgi:hypothetical protein